MIWVLHNNSWTDVAQQQLDFGIIYFICMPFQVTQIVGYQFFCCFLLFWFFAGLMFQVVKSL